MEVRRSAFGPVAAVELGRSAVQSDAAFPSLVGMVSCAPETDFEPARIRHRSAPHFRDAWTSLPVPTAGPAPRRPEHKVGRPGHGPINQALHGQKGAQAPTESCRKFFVYARDFLRKGHIIQRGPCVAASWATRFRRKDRRVHVRGDAPPRWAQEMPNTDAPHSKLQPNLFHPVWCPGARAKAIARPRPSAITQASHGASPGQRCGYPPITQAPVSSAQTTSRDEPSPSWQVQPGQPYIRSARGQRPQSRLRR